MQIKLLSAAEGKWSRHTNHSQIVFMHVDWLNLVNTAKRHKQSIKQSYYTLCFKDEEHENKKVVILQVYYLYAIVPASTTPSNTTQNTVVTMVVTWFDSTNKKNNNETH